MGGGEGYGGEEGVGGLAINIKQSINQSSSTLFCGPASGRWLHIRDEKRWAKEFEKKKMISSTTRTGHLSIV